MAGPIPVSEYLRKGEEDTSSPTSEQEPQQLKLLVVTGSGPDEENASAWMADEAVSHLKHLEVARYSLPKLRIHACVNCYGGGGRVCMHPCDRNDIESDIYRPDDQMQALYDHMLRADILLLATDTRMGGLNHYTQRFLERLNPFVNQAAAGKPLLTKKVAGVILVGDQAGPLSAGGVMGPLHTAGYGFPPHGVVTWHIPRAAPVEQVRAAFSKSKAVHDDLQLLATDLVTFARLFKGD